MPASSSESGSLAWALYIACDALMATCVTGYRGQDEVPEEQLKIECQ